MAGNSWYEAGEAIRNLVQNAVESQDFTQLSSTIANVVNQTVNGFQDALRESLMGHSGDGREDHGKRSGDSQGDETESPRYREDSADRGQTGRTAGNYRYRAGGVKFSGQEAADRIRRNMEARKRETRPVSQSLRAPGMVTGHVMALTGYGFGSMFGLALIIIAVVGDMTGVIPDFVYGIMAALTALNFWLGAMGSRRLGLAKRFRRYVAMLGNRTWCTLEEFASGTGKTISYIRKDLKKMLHRGFFPEGHLDRKETCLITDNATYQQYLTTQQEADRRAVFGENGGYGNVRPDGVQGFGRYNNYGEGSGVRPDGAQSFGQHDDYGKSSDDHSDAADRDQAPGQTGKAEANGDPRASLDRECRKLIEEGERYITHIRECNDRIPGKEISAKLDRLELVVTRIFREVERRPELAPELRKMMSYYLPTTQKLIDAYCQFDEQPIGGQNIDSTKREIESALDTINQAFENLLDSFFENTAWDISSDISVLHTMFAQEGLTGKDFPKGGK